MVEGIDRLIRGSGGVFGGSGKKGGSGENSENTLQSNSLIRFVELISEGPCEGLVGDTDEERSKSIYFDRTPIRNKNGSVNYKHVKWSERKGTPDQEVLKNFARVETPYEVNVQVTKDGGPHEVVIDNADASSLLAIVRLPALVKQKKKDGSLEKTSVQYRFDVKPQGAGWVTGDLIEIDDEKTTSAWQMAHRIDLPDNGNPWLVRMVRITDDAEDEKTANETWWDSYNLRVEGRFVYPHSALVAMEVNAEDMGSTLPSRNYRFRGLKIRVPTNYDPITRRYTGNWDGTFKIAWTNNPAWIFYDLLINDRYGLGEFVKPALVDKWTLYAIGQYCDERVKSGYLWSDGEPKFEPRYSFNGVIRDREDAWRVLQNIASTWRGMAYWSLNQVFATIDKPSDPVKLLTPANVLNGEFDYQGTAKKARYSVALVTFNDKENFYQPSVQPVINETLLQKYGWREKQVQLQGCDSRSLANRYGEWLLDVAEHETETVTFSASWENADIKPGDVIAIADPRKANARMGGRIAAATLSHITFDAPVPRTMGETYTLMVVMPGGSVVERTINSWSNQVFKEGVSQGYLECTLATDLPNEPLENASFIVKGTDIAPRQYRVISLKEEEKNIFSIIALFHDPSKYARVERGKNIQLPPYTLPDAETPVPSNFKVKEQVYLDEHGKLRAHLDLSWDRPNNRFAIKDYVVTMIHPRNGKRRLEPTTRNHITIERAVPGEYTFTIVARSYFGGVISDPLEGSIVVQGASALPLPEITNLELEEDEGQVTFNGNAPAITWKNKFSRSNDPTADDAVNVEDFSEMFKYNLVKVYDTLSNQLLRQFRVREPRYVYRFKDNKRDNAKAGRNPSREVRFRVTAVDQLERSSAPVDLTVNNVAPPQLSFTVTQRGDTMQLNITKPDADDIDGYLVWISKTAGFTPSGLTEGAGNCVYDGNGRKPIIDVERGQDYYVIAAAYDDFGKQSLNYSAQVHTVTNGSVSTGMAPSTPVGLNAITSGDTDAQGHVRSMVKFTWTSNNTSFPSETYFDHYEVEIQEDGDDYRSVKVPDTSSKYQFRAKIGKVYRFRIRACSRNGFKSAWTAWSASNTVVTAAGDTVAPEKAVITSAIGKLKGTWLAVTECAAKDYKLTRYWRYDTLANANADNGTGRTFAGSSSGETHLDQDALANDTQYYYRAAHVDKTGNVGVKSDPFQSTATTLVADADITGQLSLTKLKTTDTSNWFKNAGFLNGFDGWLAGGSWSVQTRAAAAVAGAPSKFVAQATPNGAYQQIWGGNQSGAVDVFEVSPSEVFAARFWAAATSATTNGVLSLVARFENAAGDSSYLYVTVLATLASLAGNGWQEFKGFITAPATVNSLPTAQCSIYVEVSNTATTGTVCVSKPRFRRATDVDMVSDGAISTAKVAANAITEAKVDAGLPNALAAAPSLTSLSGDIDGDGTADLGFVISWAAPTVDATHPAARLYEVELWRKATDKGTDGSITGYSLWRKFTTPDISTVVEAKRKYFHKARVRGMSFATQSGSNWSAYTNVGLQPTKYDAMTGVTPTAPVATAKANAILVTWPEPTDPTYAYSKLYQGATLITTINGSSYSDTTARTPGTGYTYTVVHYDKAGNFTNASAASNSAIYRGLSAAESNINDPSALAENNDLSLGPNIGWSEAATIIADAANAYKGSYVLKRAYAGAAASWVNRNKMLFPVRPGETYYIGGMVKTDASFAGTNVGWRLSYCSDYAGTTEIATSAVAGLTAANTTWVEYGAFVTVPSTASIAYARLEFCVYNQTAGTAFGSHGYCRPAAGKLVEAGAIKSSQTDQTLPAALTVAPVAAQVSADVDGDGKTDIAVKWTWVKPTDTSNPIVAYQVAIYENSVLIDSFQTGLTTITRKVKTRVNVAGSMVASTYYATIQTVGFNGKLSAVGSFGTSNTVNPAKKGAVLTGTFAVAGFGAIVGLPIANKLNWTPCAEPDYLESRIYRYPTLADANADTTRTQIGVISGSEWTDQFETDQIGITFWYRVQHFDRSQNGGDLSVVRSKTVKGNIAKDLVLPDGTNLIGDPNCEDVNAWLINNAAESGLGLIRELNVGTSQKGYAKYRLRTGGVGAEIRSPYIMVEPGQFYVATVWAGPVNGVAADVTCYIQNFTLDSNGDPVGAGTLNTVTKTGISTMQAFEVTFQATGPRVKFEFNTQGDGAYKEFAIASPIVRKRPSLHELPTLSAKASAFINGAYGTFGNSAEQNIVDANCAHGEEASSVLVIGQFRNTSGVTKTFTSITLRNGDNSVSQVHNNVTLGNQEVHTIVLLDSNPAGTSTTYSLRVFGSTTGNDVSERSISCLAMKA
jgi:predicted phage tail protein